MPYRESQIFIVNNNNSWNHYRYPFLWYYCKAMLHINLPCIFPIHQKLVLCTFFFFSFLLNPVLPTSQDSISLTDHLWAIYNPKVASANPCPWFFYHPMFIVLCSMHRNISVWICNEGWGTFSTIRSLEGAISRWKYDNIFYSLSGHHGKLLCSLNTVIAKLV